MLKLLLTLEGVCVLVPGLLFVAFLVHAFRAQARLEFRTQLLEMLAAAVRRRLPLVPFLEQAAKGMSPGRARIVLEIADALSTGEPLSEALAEQGEHYFPDHVTLAIQTGAGTAQLATMLDLLAEDVSKAMSSRHRFVMALLYPALVGGLLVIVGWNWLALASSVLAEYATPPPPNWPQPLALLLWGTMTLLLLLHAAGTYVRKPGLLAAAVAWLIPSVRRARRLLFGERLLRGVALMLQAGMTLPQALRSCAAALDNKSAEQATRNAAALMESGATADEALAQTPLPRFAAARAAAAVCGDPQTAATRLRNLATECGTRFQATCNRALGLVNPAALLLVGIALAGMFHRLLLTHALCLQAASPW